MRTAYIAIKLRSEHLSEIQIKATALAKTTTTVCFLSPFRMVRAPRDATSTKFLQAAPSSSAAGGDDQDFGRVPKCATTYSFTASANILGARFHPPTLSLLES
jgi:hypothetical protein